MPTLFGHRCCLSLNQRRRQSSADATGRRRHPELNANHRVEHGDQHYRTDEKYERRRLEHRSYGQHRSLCHGADDRFWDGSASFRMVQISVDSCVESVRHATGGCRYPNTDDRLYRSENNDNVREFVIDNCISDLLQFFEIPEY